jgi:hypothetical protein
MLNFGSTNIGSTPSGDYFWKFISGAAGDIELKTANGVTGIDAINPQDIRFRLLLSLYTGIPVGAFTITDGTISVLNGVADTGERIAALNAVDSSTSDTADIFVSADAMDANMNVTDGVDISGKNITKTSNDDTAGDLSTGDNVQENRNKNAHTTLVQAAGVTGIQEQLDIDKWYIKDGASLVQFAVGKDGKINTNQAQAPAVHAVKVADLPIYDNAGVLIGYIPVMT